MILTISENITRTATPPTHTYTHILIVIIQSRQVLDTRVVDNLSHTK